MPYKLHVTATLIASAIALFITDCRDSYLLVRRENDGAMMRLAIHDRQINDPSGFCRETDCKAVVWTFPDGIVFRQETAASQPSLREIEKALSDVKQQGCEKTVPIS